MNILDTVERFVEAASRPGVLGVVGHKIEKRAQRDLSAYFKVVGEQVIAHNLADAVEHGFWEHTVEVSMKQVLRRTSTLLRDALVENMKDAYTASYKMDHKPIKEAFNPIDKIGQIALDAADWAAGQVDTLITGLDSTTLDQVNQVIADAIMDQTGVQGASQGLRALFQDMSVDRAAMIASTEINRAMSAAAVDFLADNGVGYKQLIPSPGACPICLDIVAQGPIPVDEDWDTDEGDGDGPPIHPNCRCAVTGAPSPDLGDN